MRRKAKNGGTAMTMIETTPSDEAASDPKLLIVFLQYALDDVRKLSERSAHLLEQAISTLDHEVTAMVHSRSLS
jgi:hypothetical protein